MLRLQDDGMCFACGPENPIGLKLEFVETGENRTEARFVPAKVHQGFTDIVHGGILTTAMDEAMVRLLYVLGLPAVSTSLQVRLSKAARVGEPLRVVGELVDTKGRACRTKAEILRESDSLLIASAEAICIRVEPKPSEPKPS